MNSVSATRQAERPCAADRREPKDLPLHDGRLEIIELSARVALALGLPRSVGQLFGFVFGSARPVSFDEVLKNLGMSAGSASQGLRMLRRMGAVRTVYVFGDRRDFYVPELSLKKLLSGYVMEALLFQLAGTSEKLSDLHKQFSGSPSHQDEHLASRLETMLTWEQQLRSAMHAAFGRIP
jgi:DNA-binding transcriptional regulator GbsR (MarR family)